MTKADHLFHEHASVRYYAMRDRICPLPLSDESPYSDVFYLCRSRLQAKYLMGGSRATRLGADMSYLLECLVRSYRLRRHMTWKVARASMRAAWSDFRILRRHGAPTWREPCSDPIHFYLLQAETEMARISVASWVGLTEEDA